MERKSIVSIQITPTEDVGPSLAAYSISNGSTGGMSKRPSMDLLHDNYFKYQYQYPSELNISSLASVTDGYENNPAEKVRLQHLE